MLEENFLLNLGWMVVGRAYIGALKNSFGFEKKEESSHSTIG
jgi:hypothetical protein